MVTGESSGADPLTGNKRVAWSSIPREDLVKYSDAMGEMLDSLVVPADIVHGDKICFCEQHVFQIIGYLIFY